MALMLWNILRLICLTFALHAITCAQTSSVSARKFDQFGDIANGAPWNSGLFGLVTGQQLLRIELAAPGQVLADQLPSGDDRRDTKSH